MMKVTKKLAACVLTGILVCQPIAVQGPDGLAIVAKAHSSHHADAHHSGGNVSSSESYYYCDGHSAHLHEGGVCPYSYYYCDGHSAHLHEGGVCPYSQTADISAGSFSDETVQASASSRSTVMDMSGKTIELSSGDTISVSKDLIRILQDALNQKGYDCGKADGVVGAKTKEALAAYLEENEGGDMDSLIISMIAKGLGIQ